MATKKDYKGIKFNPNTNYSSYSDYDYKNANKIQNGNRFYNEEDKKYYDDNYNEIKDPYIHKDGLKRQEQWDRLYSARYPMPQERQGGEEIPSSLPPNPKIPKRNDYYSEDPISEGQYLEDQYLGDQRKKEKPYRKPTYDTRQELSKELMNADRKVFDSELWDRAIDERGAWGGVQYALAAPYRIGAANRALSRAGQSITGDDRIMEDAADLGRIGNTIADIAGVGTSFALAPNPANNMSSQQMFNQTLHNPMTAKILEKMGKTSVDQLSKAQQYALRMGLEAAENATDEGMRAAIMRDEDLGGTMKASAEGAAAGALFSGATKFIGDGLGKLFSKGGNVDPTNPVDPIMDQSRLLNETNPRNSLNPDDILSEQQYADILSRQYKQVSEDFIRTDYKNPQINDIAQKVAEMNMQKANNIDEMLQLTPPKIEGSQGPRMTGAQEPLHGDYNLPPLDRQGLPQGRAPRPTEAPTTHLQSGQSIELPERAGGYKPKANEEVLIHDNGQVTAGHVKKVYKNGKADVEVITPTGTKTARGKMNVNGEIELLPEKITPKDKTPIGERDLYNVSDKEMKAYQYVNPEVKPYYKQNANELLTEMRSGVRGEKAGQVNEYGEVIQTSTNRHMPQDIEALKDTTGKSYEEIEEAIQNIIKDHGNENNALSRKVETLLHDRLSKGYNAYGEEIPANKDYMNTVKQIEGDPAPKVKEPKKLEGPLQIGDEVHVNNGIKHIPATIQGKMGKAYQVHYKLPNGKIEKVHLRLDDNRLVLPEKMQYEVDKKNYGEHRAKQLAAKRSGDKNAIPESVDPYTEQKKWEKEKADKKAAEAAAKEAEINAKLDNLRFKSGEYKANGNTHKTYSAGGYTIITKGAGEYKRFYVVKDGEEIKLSSYGGSHLEETLKEAKNYIKQELKTEMKTAESKKVDPVTAVTKSKGINLESPATKEAAGEFKAGEEVKWITNLHSVEDVTIVRKEIGERTGEAGYIVTVKGSGSEGWIAAKEIKKTVSEQELKDLEVLSKKADDESWNRKTKVEKKLPPAEAKLKKEVDKKIKEGKESLARMKERQRIEGEKKLEKRRKEKYHVSNFCTITKGEGKKGGEYFFVKPKEKTAREGFQELKDLMTEHGAVFYQRGKGFAFKEDPTYKMKDLDLREVYEKHSDMAEIENKKKSQLSNEEREILAQNKTEWLEDKAANTASGDDLKVNKDLARRSEESSYMFSDNSGKKSVEHFEGVKDRSFEYIQDNIKYLDGLKEKIPTEYKNSIAELEILRDRFLKKYHTEYEKYLSMNSKTVSWHISGRGGMDTGKYNAKQEKIMKKHQEVFALENEFKSDVDKIINRLKPKSSYQEQLVNVFENSQTDYKKYGTNPQDRQWKEFSRKNRDKALREIMVNDPEKALELSTKHDVEPKITKVHIDKLIKNLDVDEITAGKLRDLKSTNKTIKNVVNILTGKEVEVVLPAPKRSTVTLKFKTGEYVDGGTTYKSYHAEGYTIIKDGNKRYLVFKDGEKPDFMMGGKTFTVTKLETAKRYIQDTAKKQKEIKKKYDAKKVDPVTATKKAKKKEGSKVDIDLQRHSHINLDPEASVAGMRARGTRQRAKQTFEDGKKSRFVDNSMNNSDAIPDDFKSDMLRPDYQPINNKRTWNKAKKRVKKDHDAAYREYMSGSGRRTADYTALGQAVIIDAIKRGDYERANTVSAHLSLRLTEAGQEVQAASMMKRLTPEGMLMFGQNVVAKVNDKLPDGKKIKLSEADGKKITDSMKQYKERIKELEDLQKQLEQNIVDLKKTGMSQEPKSYDNYEVRFRDKAKEVHDLKVDLEENSKELAELKEQLKDQLKNNADEIEAKTGLENEINTKTKEIEDLKKQLEKKSKEKQQMKQNKGTGSGNGKGTGSGNGKGAGSDIDPRYRWRIEEKYNDLKKQNSDLKKRIKKLEREAEIKLGETKKVIADKIPPTKADSMKALQRISMLLNGKTMIRNTLGNVIMESLENVKDLPAYYVDQKLSKITGKQTTALPWEGMKEYKEGLIKGFNGTLDDYHGKVDTSPTSGQFELRKDKNFNDKTWYGKAAHEADRITSAALELGDRPFYEATYAKYIAQQKKLAGVEIETPEMIQEAQRLALERTFQNVTAFSREFMKIRQSINNFGGGIAGKITGNSKEKVDFGMGNIVLPFAKTPANILDMAVQYTPIGLGKTAHELKRIKSADFNQKVFVDSLGRNITGTAMIWAGYNLAKVGGLTGGTSRDGEIRDLERQMGKSPYSFKVADSYITFDWAQPASMPLAIGADMYQAGKTTNNVQDQIKEAVVNGVGTLLNQSVFRGVQEFMGGYDVVGNWANTAANAPLQFVPTFTKQLGQLKDGGIKSTYSDTKGKEKMNKIKSRLPMVNSTLYPRLDMFGNDKEYYQGKNNLFNVMVNPSYKSTETNDKVTQMVYNIYNKLGTKDHFPTYDLQKFKLNSVDYQLTEKEHYEVNQWLGKETYKVFEKFANDKVFSNVKPEMQQKILKARVDALVKIAKNKIVKDRKKNK